MRALVARRILQLVPVLLGVTLLAFSLTHLAGGDAVESLYAAGGVAASPEALARRRAELGLDRPLAEQYLGWLADALRGDLGKSLVTGEPVSAAVAARVPATALLALSALAASLAVSVPLGLACAWGAGRAWDRVVRAASFVGNALPGFLVALLLVLVLSVRLRLLPVLSAFGEGGPAWQALVLPAASLAIPMSAKLARQVRALALEELGRDYVRGASSRVRPANARARCWRPPAPWRDAARGRGYGCGDGTDAARGGCMGERDEAERLAGGVRVITHSAVRLEGAAGTVAYVDPYGLTDADAAHDADYVLVTHTHYDHLSPADYARVAGGRTVVVAPASASDEVAALGAAEVRLLAPGGRLALPGLEVEAVAAYNVEPERLAMHPRSNGWLGYVVSLDDEPTRIYVAGDTDQNPDNEGVRCDVALVPVGGTYTMDPRQAAAFVCALRPRVAIPTHYGSVVGSPEDFDAFAAAMAARDPAVTVLRRLER